MWYEQLSFWRNPQSAVFTFIFPVVFVVIMGALFGGVGKSSYFGGLSALQYYVPTIAALSVLGSCYGQLAVALAARRQAGILKRIRATPLPAWAYFTGLLAHCVLVSVTFTRHAGADWRHLAVLAAWGMAGAAVAVRRFRWDPRPE